MVLSMSRWVGKTAVVTGSSSGIGAAITEALIERGVNVIGIARRVDLVEALAKKLSSKPAKLTAYKADISNPDEVVAAFKWIKDNVGCVSILINNAGVSKYVTLIDGDYASWKDVFDVNVLGLCQATKEAVNMMKENNIDGHVVHINSILGHSVPNFYDQYNVYPASKHAVTALTETLRQELLRLKSKIKITSISPGFVESEMTVLNKNVSAEKKTLMACLPILKGEDIADGVVYVLSTPPHVQVQELTIKPVGEPF